MFEQLRDAQPSVVDATVQHTVAALWALVAENEDNAARLVAHDGLALLVVAAQLKGCRHHAHVHMAVAALWSVADIPRLLPYVTPLAGLCQALTRVSQDKALPNATRLLVTNCLLAFAGTGSTDPPGSESRAERTAFASKLVSLMGDSLGQHPGLCLVAKFLTAGDEDMQMYVWGARRGIVDPTTCSPGCCCHVPCGFQVCGEDPGQHRDDPASEGVSCRRSRPACAVQDCVHLQQPGTGACGAGWRPLLCGSMGANAWHILSHPR